MVFGPLGDFDDLGAGETDSVSFTYTVEDPSGAETTDTVTITVTGVNDAPVTASDSLETTQNSTGQINLLDNDSDPDGDALTVTRFNGLFVNGTLAFSVTTATGRDVTVTVAEDGSLTVDPNGNFNGLGAGETDSFSFSYAVEDPSGARTEDLVAITITGVNDDPTITGGDTSGSVTEDGTLIETGTLTANDIDRNDTLTWSVQGGTVGDFGTLTVDQNGDWTYTLDNDNADVQALDDGETLTDSFTIEVDDGNGGTDTQTVDITIDGADEGPQQVSVDFDSGLDGLSLLPNTFGGFVWDTPQGNLTFRGTVLSLGVVLDQSGIGSDTVPGVGDGLGDTYIFNNGATQPLFITREGGGDFTFVSAEVAVGSISGLAGSAVVTFEGFNGGVSQGTQSIPLNENGGGFPASGGFFGEIDELRVTANMAGVTFGLDDFVFELV